MKHNRLKLMECGKAVLRVKFTVIKGKKSEANNLTLYPSYQKKKNKLSLKLIEEGK